MGKTYDVPQMLFTSTGAIAMQYPLAVAQVENGVLCLGFLGGVLRGIPVVGKYAVLDGGYVLKKYNPTLRNYIQKWQRKTKFDNKKK